eukprot:GFUD01041892.1.p1 GENE.GFUD01041892.1~~GFUD01041892.1.p1  ORF type:complete len:217 (+),score=70.95 GFUD01041892.1:153-803(+)
MKMETERMDGEEMGRMVQGSLLNKVYAIQHERERQTSLVSQMTQLTVSPSSHLTTSDKLLLSFPPHKLGVATDPGHSDRSVEGMEVPPNPAYTQYPLERSVIEGTSCDPHSQEVKRNDPVYLSSIATHGILCECGGQQQQVLQQQLVLHQQQLELQQQQQLELQHQQQQLELQHQHQHELQQRSCNSQIVAEQLGGFVLPNNQPDLIPLIDSMQLE